MLVLQINLVDEILLYMLVIWYIDKMINSHHSFYGRFYMKKIIYVYVLKFNINDYFIFNVEIKVTQRR